jgi:hypothetical protein
MQKTQCAVEQECHNNSSSDGNKRHDRFGNSVLLNSRSG